jgi:hypothetical protein
MAIARAEKMTDQDEANRALLENKSDKNYEALPRHFPQQDPGAR